MIPTLTRPVSQLCNQSQLDEPVFAEWCKACGMPSTYRRKYWELAYIAQALQVHGKLEAGNSGLCFGVGREPLPALFASMGINVLATDLPAEQAHQWIATNQHANGVEQLRRNGVADFDESRLSFQSVDMNHIPLALRLGDFDFVWSTNSLDHLGTIENGLDFIRNSLTCLKPGGVAVHVTEFNLSSNDETIESGPVVVFRERDIRALAESLTGPRGHGDGFTVELNLHRGDGEMDNIAACPPYETDPRLRLFFSGLIMTSIGLIIQRGGGNGC